MRKGANRRQRVLVTGLFEPAALAVIRRLGSDGWHVTAADGHRMAYGLYSRYVARRVRIPFRPSSSGPTS